ncbi:hypothetical protein NECAME_08631 [Necator americanus]|uniref:Uncharacterized protein n=1 Tax=Necator americanus TaxID=51031 RepID=W2TJW8_NECAM|nr:hypothetical protein NECAME_08631 [Necator americanus]ETN81272.1 hypothetical protein NECAME_08631 [Necator americanus]
MPPQPGPFGQQPNPFASQALFYGQQPQFSQVATDSRRGSHGTTSSTGWNLDYYKPRVLAGVR